MQQCQNRVHTAHEKQNKQRNRKSAIKFSVLFHFHNIWYLMENVFDGGA